MSDDPAEVPGDRRPGPSVYARLAEEADVQSRIHSPPRWVRWIGWGLCAALIIAVVDAAVAVHPW